MNIPITGYILIPLGLLIVLLPWRYCLIALMVFAMMSPAAVVNVGKFGLQPGYYLSILLILRTFAEIMAGRFTLNTFVLWRMRPVFYFDIVVLVVLFIALCFFQREVAVLPGTGGFKSAVTHPFHLSRENYTQIAYLTLNTCLIYVMGHQGARRYLPQLLRDWDIAVVCGLCFAVAICLWQISSLYAGIYFPSDFFYSNAGYSRADSQSMVGLFRINGPFEEPSTLGYTFSGYLLFAWLRYRLYPTAFSVVLIAACIFCMLVSTSTTAFAGLFLFGCFVLYDIVVARIHLLTRDYKLSSGQLAAIGIIALAILAGCTVVATNWGAIHVVLEKTLFQKSQSTSFQEREFADILAMHIFVETYGIGVGLGSDKANSMLLSLLSNTGIVGCVLFGAFIVTILQPVRTKLYPQANEALRKAIRPFQWGVLGLVLMHIISNPNLSTLTLWVELGGVLALQAAVHKSLAVPENGIAPACVTQPGRGVPTQHARGET